MSKPRTGAPKRVAAGLLAGSLSIFGVALAPTAGAVEDVTNERLAGATRYGTAAAIAADEAFAAPTMAIVASGENANLADALAASTLAGANAPAPIILTQTNTYTAEAKSGLAALKGKGVSRVTIVGGTAAVSTTVEDAIEADGFTVTRVAGTDRFATAAAIAQAANTANAADPVAGEDVALIASGTSFADALAASPAAANLGLPLLLVNADSIPQATRDALDALDINQAVILGGTVPVSESVASELQTLTGQAPERLAGTNRFGTAAAIGDYEINTLGFTATSAILANGLTLVDALTAGPLGGIVEAPIVLTASLPAESQAFLDKYSDRITKLYVMGGTAAVDDATVTGAETAAETTENDPATPGNSQTSVLNGPELQSVQITDFDLDDPADLTVEYTYQFDTEIEDDADAGDFHLYNADTQLSPDGTDVEVSGDRAAVTFNAADDGVSDATLAGVSTGAVTDEDGNENPPATVSIPVLSGNGGTGSDLVDIELTDEEDAVATFVFNGSIYPVALAGYQFNLVDEDGVVYPGTGAETTPDEDEASTEVEVTFAGLTDDDIANEPTFDDVVRGYIVDLSNGGRVQNVDLGGDSNNFADLEGIELPADNGDLDDDQVLFVFDEEIDSAADASDFNLYFGVGGSGTVSGTGTPDIDGNEVIVNFDEEAVNDFVAGGWVDADAVTTNGDNTAENPGVGTQNPNRADGELFEFTATRGEVLGPQLTGVDITEETDSFGEFEEWVVTYTFDKDLTDAANVGGFELWFNDGDEVDTLDLDNCDVDNGNEVVCIDEDEDSDVANAVVASVEYNSVTTEDTTNLGNGDDTFPNPEASFEVSADADAA